MLTSKQRAYLRSLANPLETLFQVGKDGIGDNLVKQTRDALEAREIIKLRCLETSGMTARQAADTLADRCGAESVQVIGSRFVLYRQSSDEKKRKIVLPAEKQK